MEHGYVVHGNVYINNIAGDGNNAIIGDNNNVVSRVYDEIAEQRMIITNAQRHITRLLDIVQKQMKN